MRARLSFENRLVRAVVLLGFLSCLVGGSSLSSQPTPNEHQAVSRGPLAESANGVDALPVNHSDSILTGDTEIGVPEEFEVALEDEASVEMFRADIQQRTFHLDRPVIRPEDNTKFALTSRLNSSPPLLE